MTELESDFWVDMVPDSPLNRECELGLDRRETPNTVLKERKLGLDRRVKPNTIRGNDRG